MRIPYVVLMVLSILVLTACKTEKIQYNGVEDQLLSSFSEAENLDEERYILYYFDSSQNEPDTFHEEVQDFLGGYDTIPIYLVDTANIASEQSSFGSYENGPVMHLVAKGEAYQSIVGFDDITQFIEEREDHELDYVLFSDRILGSYTDVLSVTNDIHFEYFYSPYCSHCNTIKADILSFFLNLEDMDFYLINVSETSGVNPVPDFIGTPSLYVVYDGQIIDSYIGSFDIPSFLSQYRQGAIDYDDFN